MIQRTLPGGNLRLRGYELKLLRSLRRDDVARFLGPQPGVYISSCSHPDWFARFKIVPLALSHYTKHEQMFGQMAAGSKWIIVTPDRPGVPRTRTWSNGSRMHLGTRGMRSRISQILQTIELAYWLVRHKDEYAYTLVYNFALPVFLAPLFSKYFLAKPLYVDYEDDYTTRRRSSLKNGIERALRRLVSGAVCINEQMTRYFPQGSTIVCNGFADLSYMAGVSFRLQEGCVLLFSGTLDDIRGADLIPDLVQALRKVLSRFTLAVTGTGQLRDEISRLGLPEVKYLGLLPHEAYEEVFHQADYCLVLQKPDHPFSMGSFPSKIDTYAKHRKPILVLEMATL